MQAGKALCTAGIGDGRHLLEGLLSIMELLTPLQQGSQNEFSFKSGFIVY